MTTSSLADALGVSDAAWLEVDSPALEGSKRVLLVVGDLSDDGGHEVVRTETIPRTEDGLDRPRALALWCAAQPERTRGPRWLSRGPTDEGWEGVAWIPPTEATLEGHFPDLPILPGITQLHDLLLDPARAHWSDLGGLREVPRLKFTRPLLPGDRVVVRLSRPSPDRVDFEITHGDTRCAAGALHFGEVG